MQMRNCIFIALLLGVSLSMHAMTTSNQTYLDDMLVAEVVQGNLPKVQELLQLGADANSIDPYSGKTALQEALFNGAINWGSETGDTYKSIIQLLLYHGADPKLQDTHGQNALDYARMSGHRALIDMFQEAEDAQD